VLTVIFECIGVCVLTVLFECIGVCLWVSAELYNLIL